jgi:hypothetical protein
VCGSRLDNECFKGYDFGRESFLLSDFSGGLAQRTKRLFLGAKL